MQHSNKTDSNCRRFLVTTALEGFWDKSANLVFLGEWCLRYTCTHENGSPKTEMVRDPFDSGLKSDRAVTLANDFFERLLPQLAMALNSLHGKQCSIRYWRILIGPWLRFYILILYNRYSSIEVALEHYPGIATLGLSESDFVVPVDTNDFMLRINGDLFNLQLFTRILCALGVDVPRKSLYATTGSRRTPIPCKSVRSIANVFLRNLINFLIRRVFGQRAVIIKNGAFPRTMLIQLAIASGLRVLPSFVQPPAIPLSELDRRKRAEIGSFLSGSGSFEELLIQLLPGDIPQCYVENYKVIESYCLKQYPPKPIAVFSVNDWYYDEAFKQWAGNCVEAGIPLLGSQHGGGYGMRAYLPAEQHETSVTDRYYSWGWDRQDCFAEVVPFSSIKLWGRPMIGADNRKEGILFALTCPSRYLYAFPFTISYWAAYVDWQLRFANALPSAVQKVMRIRPYREDMGWQIAERWRDKMPQIRIESWEVSFVTSMQNCRLYICDILFTTCFEALATNKPIIMFWDREANPMRPEAEPYLDDLRAMGILFDSPEAAANAAARVYMDVETWWNAPGLQRIRQRFCDRFARVSRDSVREWVAELRDFDQITRRQRIG